MYPVSCAPQMLCRTPPAWLDLMAFHRRLATMRKPKPFFRAFGMLVGDENLLWELIPKRFDAANLSDLRIDDVE